MIRNTHHDASVRSAPVKITMPNETLKVIDWELFETMRRNIGIDPAVMNSVRAKRMVALKRVRRKRCYRRTSKTRR